MVTFYRPDVKPVDRQKIGEGSEKSNEKGKEKSREKILGVIAGNPNITTREIADIVELSIAGVEKVIRMLKKQKQLRRVGPDKGGHWEVV